MSRRLPWMKWYPADWRSEPTLRMCRRPARSFWQDLIGLMHESHQYGHLLINGIKPTTEQLARVTGDSEREVRTWLAELEAAGVYSKTEDGVIYSRRMVRDYAKAQRDVENGKGGGNPRLRKGVNPTTNPKHAVGDKAQIPDARDQEESPSLRSGVSAEPTPPPEPSVPELPAGLDRRDGAQAFHRAVDEWNSLADELGLPAVKVRDDGRRTQWRARFGTDGERWPAALAAIRASSFCRGNNDRGWRADFDFLLQRKSLNRLLEGGYADRNGGARESSGIDWEALRARDAADAA